MNLIIITSEVTFFVASLRNMIIIVFGPIMREGGAGEVPAFQNIQTVPHLHIFTPSRDQAVSYVPFNPDPRFESDPVVAVGSNPDSTRTLSRSEIPLKSRFFLIFLLKKNYNSVIISQLFILPLFNNFYLKV